jgi:gibberellin 2-oxidase
MIYISMDSINSDPPFEETYKNLFNKTQNIIKDELMVDDECELPVIDLGRLNEINDVASQECKSMIAKASQDWGFFQVINHGISRDILRRLRYEQEKVFKEPFDKKRREDKFLNLTAGSYRWGTPTATCIKQLSLSEAFHIPLTDILGSTNGSNTNLRYVLTIYTNYLIMLFIWIYALFLFHSNLPLISVFLSRLVAKNST